MVSANVMRVLQEIKDGGISELFNSDLYGQVTTLVSHESHA